MKKRLERAFSLVAERKLSCMLITSYENYRYFSGFTGSNCALIIAENEAFALTDGRYATQIALEAPHFKHIITERSMNAHIAELLSEIGASSVGYETKKLTDFEISSLRKLAPEITFVPQTDFGEGFRIVKDEAELESIKKAAKIADEALRATVASLSLGVTEREVAARLEYEMAKRGSERPAFETIAVSGERGALPHGKPTDAKIPENTLLTLDFGAVYNGYCSDITRTLHIGKPSDELSRLWDTVFGVFTKCVDFLRAGITAAEIDSFERSLFAKVGMESFVVHSLGHGVGLNIHEAPTLSFRSSEVIEENSVVTIEPGLYVPNLGGCRIENTFLVTKNGAVSLTSSPIRYDISLR